MVEPSALAGGVDSMLSGEIIARKFERSSRAGDSSTTFRPRLARGAACAWIGTGRGGRSALTGPSAGA